jgi:hypothetical protein
MNVIGASGLGMGQAISLVEHIDFDHMSRIGLQRFSSCSFAPPQLLACEANTSRVQVRIGHWIDVQTLKCVVRVGLAQVQCDSPSADETPGAGRPMK